MWVSGAAAAKQSARDLLWLTHCIFLDSSHHCSEMPSLHVSKNRLVDGSSDLTYYGGTAPTRTCLTVEHEQSGVGITTTIILHICAALHQFKESNE